MSTANAAATLEQANGFSTDYALADIIIKAGATVLATYPLSGFVASNSGNNGLATANAITAQNNAGTGTADTALLKAGAKEFSLTIGVDITISDTAFISGVSSSVSGLTVTFPA